MDRLLHETSEIGHYSGNKRNIDAEYEEVEEEANPNDAQDWMENVKTKEIQARFAEKHRGQIDSLKKEGKPKEITYFCGSSHIDIAWCWRLLQASEKARVTFTKACFHVEHISEYTFSGSQSHLFDWIRIRYPELFDRIKRAVATGRFEMVGGSWVEYDGHIPSGEALVRQRLLGQLFLKKHFGKYASIEYLPDSFGFATQLPQILTKSNAKAFYTNKLGSNTVNKFPFGTFLWESLDGSRILAESLHGASRRLLKPGMQDKIPPFSYESADFDIPGMFSSDVVPCKILPYGKGDGGHGPTGEEVQDCLFMHKQGLITLAPVQTYFDKVAAECEDRVPVWKDELYLEWHRGTMTTHSLVKHMNRYNEYMLPALEKLCVLACLNANHAYPNDAIEESWRVTLLNQFHDVLPGSCIPETYDDCWDMWAWQARVHNQLLHDAFAALVSCLTTGSGEKQHNASPGSKVTSRLLHFNPLDHSVKTTIEIPAGLLGDARPGAVVLEDGSKHGISFLPRVDCPGVPFYEVPERIAFLMELKPHHVTVLSFLDAQDVEKSKNVRYRATKDVIEMENQVLKVVIDVKTAAIVSLKLQDGKAWRETIQQGKKRFKDTTPELEPGIKLHSFFDFPKDFAAWNMDPQMRQHPNESRVIFSRIADASDNHVTAETVVEYPVKNPEKMDSMDISTVTTRYTLYHDDPMLYVVMAISFDGKHVTMKLDIPTFTNGKEVEAEVAYGEDRRSTMPSTPRNVERWENLMHTWINVQAPDDSWGFAVINDGKYGVDYHGGYLGISIIRGQDYPNAHYEAWVYKERFDNVDAGREYQASWTDQGNHVVRLALYPHASTATEAKVLERAHAFNSPLLACTIPSSPNPPRSSGRPGLTLPVADPPVSVTVVKPAENDGELHDVPTRDGKIAQRIVVRAVNTGNATVGSTIDVSGLHVKDVVECDLIERKIAGQCDTISDGKVITKIKATWKPYEIKTFGLLI